MDDERAGYCIVIVKDQIYVLGGTIQWFSTTDDCVKYDLSKSIWTRIKSMNADRDLAAAVSYNDEKIFIFGGRSIDSADSICCSTCESYNINTSIWEEIRSLPQPRHSAHAIVVNTDCILIIGNPYFAKFTSSFKYMFNFTVEITQSIARRSILRKYFIFFLFSNHQLQTNIYVDRFNRQYSHSYRMGVMLKLVFFFFITYSHSSHSYIKSKFKLFVISLPESLPFGLSRH